MDHTFVLVGVGTPSTALACSCEPSWRARHISIACPTMEQTPHSLTCCPRANCCTKEVRFETCCSMEVVLTSLTRLGGGSRSFLVLNYWELAAMLEMRFRAASGVFIHECFSTRGINHTPIHR